jgi:hypothetical protein
VHDGHQDVVITLHRVVSDMGDVHRSLAVLGEGCAQCGNPYTPMLEDKRRVRMIEFNRPVPLPFYPPLLALPH